MKAEIMSASKAETTEYMVRWKNEMYRALVRSRPNVPKEKIIALVDKKFKERFKNPRAFLYNNLKMPDIAFAEEKYSMGLLEVVQFIKEHNPILTESGVMFKQHKNQGNPIAKLLWKWKAERSAFKKKALEYFEKGDMVKSVIFDLFQANKKVNMNSYYGGSGLKTAVMYNLHTAESVTLKGQRIISSSCTCMDALLSNNTPFMHMCEFYTFIERTLSEEYKVDLMALHCERDYIPTTKDVAVKMYKSFHQKSRYNISYDLIYDVVSQLTEEEQLRIYYKNNIYAFLILESNKNILTTIMDKLNGWYTVDTESNFFIDPNRIPDFIKEEIMELYHRLSDCVLYNYMANQRVDRLKHEPRASVVTIDTDSNMINVDPFINFMKYVVMQENMLDFDPNIFRFNSVNILSSILTKMINDVMYKFTITSGIEDHEMRLLINMKNEFLYKIFLTTDAKKNYVGLVELKEGRRPKTLKLDIKGLQIRKSSVNAHVREELADILEYDIMKASPMSVPKVLNKISMVEDKIRTSLLRGEKKFCSPQKVKDPRAYAEPLQQAGFRGAVLWNLLYPENKIELPSKVYTLKLKITSSSDFDRLKCGYPDVWEKLDPLFGDKATGEVSEYFKNKGISVLSIPLNETMLPEWTSEFILTNEIITASTKVMLPVLKSLALTSATSSQMETFSNIVQL